MGIEVLPIEVVNQIAAGEVIERPSFLLKELVENSIDAGSTEIRIEFSEGGRNIEVQDNGSGIAPVDLPKALLRHATSKITKADDLFSLSSFGFRGEALASIAAAAELEIISATDQSGEGYRLFASFGQVTGDLNKMSAQKGTRIRVTKLFQNMPARLKFLKSAASEHTQIKQMIKLIAMANPLVQFHVFADGEMIAFYPAEKGPRALSERIKKVLELDELFEGQSQVGSMTCQAFFTSPMKTQKTAKNIFFFAQERPIKDGSLQAAVLDAYRTLLMHGEYPSAVVFLKVPAHEIDVNIHPTKSQVKFLNASDAYRAVHNAIKRTLERAPWLKDLFPERNMSFADVKPNSEGPAQSPWQGASPSPTKMSQSSPSGSGFNKEASSFVRNNYKEAALRQASFSSFRAPEFEQVQFKTKTSFKTYGEEGLIKNSQDALTQNQPEGNFKTESSEEFASPQSELWQPPIEAKAGSQASSLSSSLDSTQSNATTLKETSIAQAANTSSQFDDYLLPLSEGRDRARWKELQLIGQAHLTYLVLQNEKAILFVDQHAAHERVNFEKLMRKWKEGKGLDVQKYLFPLTLDMSADRVKALMAHQEELKRFGIVVESFGNETLGVTAAPLILKESVLADELDRLSHALVDHGGGFHIEKAMGDVAARLACHSSIRAGQSLSEAEMKTLLADMDEFPESTFCPHGRPVYIEYPINRLEKDFGRIL